MDKKAYLGYKDKQAQKEWHVPENEESEMTNLEILRRGIERIFYRKSIHREHRYFKHGKPKKMRKAK